MNVIHPGVGGDATKDNAPWLPIYTVLFLSAEYVEKYLQVSARRQIKGMIKVEDQNIFFKRIDFAEMYKPLHKL